MAASIDTDDPREYAEAALDQCTVTRRTDDDTLIGLPNPYVVPNTSFFEELYYWDSYFTILGLLELDRVDLAKGMVENCTFLLDEYGFVPNGNRTYYRSRSQPPFLAPMVTAVGDALDDDAWLADALPYLEREYERYWTEQPHLIPETGLSRYYDASGEHEHAEDESGWDLTPRFQQRANDFLPVCLNSYLYGYETTIADLHERVGDAEAAPAWRERAARRSAAVDDYLWDDDVGLYFDYDYVNDRQSPVRSLATFAPLWTGLASDEQAARVVEHLDEFEYEGGLVTCDEDYGVPERQWNYPNGWPPLQWLVVDALDSYGYASDATRVAEKWCRVCEDVFAETGVFWEKYDVVDVDVGTSDRRYEVQDGFSWTNAVYIALQERF